MGTQKTSRSSPKPAAIRSAAQRLFLARGMRQTSMDAVAAEAGVTKQTVYRYFGSKEQLFVAVLRSLVVERLQPDIAAAAHQATRSGEELEDTLLAVASRILDRVLDPVYLDLIRVLIAEGRQYPELVDLFRTAAVGPMAAALSEVLGVRPPEHSSGAEAVPPALRLFIAPILAYEVEGMLGNPSEVRARARAELPGLVRLLAAAISADTGRRP
ncbi:TetR/AcrR family transcriptional regulator [Allosalinactinospora lopnorensis]|uniref:TetR/AcrR family transcriptional regulator n=1 Tax=Allosalinactinospora lopnorensis TaxID=1352348 RepID=UPI000698F904|nr:TetR/AcrR family transcriptional regulator [Allosalinactinospora lopnorensis]